jgi:predicted ferric reductase
MLTKALWDLSRGTGIVALCLLTLSIVLGIVTRSGRNALGIGRFGVAELHKSLALTAVTFIGVHVVALLFDPYAQLKIVDVVVPYIGAYRPLWLGMGTLALDLIVVVTITSLLRHRIGPDAFHLVHWTVYALFPIAVAHVLGTGTDAGSTWVLAIVGTCVVLAVAAVMWRLTDHYRERGFDRVPRQTVPR